MLVARLSDALIVVAGTAALLAAGLLPIGVGVVVVVGCVAAVRIFQYRIRSRRRAQLQAVIELAPPEELQM